MGTATKINHYSEMHKTFFIRHPMLALVCEVCGKGRGTEIHSVLLFLPVLIALRLGNKGKMLPPCGQGAV